MAGMPNLHTIQAVSNERFDAGSRSGCAGMSQHRNAAGVVNHRDRILHGESILWHECGAAVAEIAVEGVAKVGGPAVVDEGARNVWPANSAAARLRQNVLDSHLHAKLV